MALVLIAAIAIPLFVMANGMRDVNRLLDYLEKRIPGWTERVNAYLAERLSTAAADLRARRERRRHTRRAEPLPPTASPFAAHDQPASSPSAAYAPPPALPPVGSPSVDDDAYRPLDGAAAAPRRQPTTTGGPGWGIREQNKPFGDGS